MILRFLLEYRNTRRYRRYKENYLACFVSAVSLPILSVFPLLCSITVIVLTLGCSFCGSWNVITIPCCSCCCRNLVIKQAMKNLDNLQLRLSAIFDRWFFSQERSPGVDQLLINHSFLICWFEMSKDCHFWKNFKLTLRKNCSIGVKVVFITLNPFLVFLSSLFKGQLSTLCSGLYLHGCKDRPIVPVIVRACFKSGH